MAENPIKQKSYAFALEVIKLCRTVSVEKKEYVLTNQLLKAGTSIGANVEESQQAQSVHDFIAKLSISLKEAYESRYWLRLLRDSNIASNAELQPFLKDIDEIIRILVSIIRSSKDRRAQIRKG